MKNKKPIYGLVMGIRQQAEIIDKHCFGTCKKIICGAMAMDGIGEMGVCRTHKENCPRFEAEMQIPIGDVNGEPVFIRKLK